MMIKLTLKPMLLLCALMAGVGSTRADVKWKKVDLSTLSNNDVVAIIDLNTGKAMTNDNGDSKKPGFGDVELNDDKDRIMGDVADNIQWTVTKAENVYKFGLNGSNFLSIASDKDELRVGTASDNTFGFEDNFLYVNKGENKYYVGVKSQMLGGDSWELNTDKANADIKDTQIAFFKKVNDNQKKTTLKFTFENYEINKNGYTARVIATPVVTGPENPTITYSSSNEAVATVDNDGSVSIIKKGTTKITATVAETNDYDKASASYTLRVDDTSNNEKGCRTNPLTVDEAITLASGETLEAGCCYFIKGIVSKVSNPFSDMLGGIEIPGMEDMDFSQLNIPGLSSSGGTSYYISSNGLTDNQLKVLNGNKQTTSSNETGEVEFIGLTSNDIGVGDVVLVYGPLVYTEDKSMIPGGGGNNNNEPSKSAKVDEVNYIPSDQMIRRLTKGNVTEMKDNTGKVLSEFYILNTNNVLGFTVPETPQISMKSSDEEIAKWEKDAVSTDSTFVAKGSGTVTITVSAKVIVASDNPETTDKNEEKAYTMKCKYDIQVVSRDLEPLGKNNGNYELVTNVNDLKNGDVLLLVGDSNDKHYAMGNADAKMGGKEAKEITISEGNKIKSTDVPDGALEVTLEKDGDDWRFIAGKSGNDNLYLYISDPGSSGSGGYDISSLTGSGAKIKTGTFKAVGDSCKLTITNVVINNNETTDSVKIKYNFTRVKDNKDEAKNVMKFSNSSYSTSFGGYEDSENAKGSMLHIYRFVPSTIITVAFDPVSEWRTVVCDRNVTLGTGLSAYYATAINEGEITMTLANPPLKAGVPYLLHGSKGWGNYELTITDEEATVPSNNLLRVSDNSTSSSSNIYVLAKKGSEVGFEVGFYKWTGGLLGSGRVYLDATTASRNFYSFEINESTTDIHQLNIEQSSDIYDLQGRKVVNPVKGVYIMDGKKIVVKD